MHPVRQFLKDIGYDTWKDKVEWPQGNGVVAKTDTHEHHLGTVNFTKLAEWIELEELRQDIEKNGMTFLLVVEQIGLATYRIIDGKKRFKATPHFSSYPCTVRASRFKYNEHVICVTGEYVTTIDRSNLVVS